MVLNSQYIWIAAAVVAALFVILLVARGVRRSRTVALRDKYGSEYDRAIEATGSRTRAEEDLLARAQYASELDIQPLTGADRARYRMTRIVPLSPSPLYSGERADLEGPRQV